MITTNSLLQPLIGALLLALVCACTSAVPSYEVGSVDALVHWKDDLPPTFRIELESREVATRWQARIENVPTHTRESGAFDDSSIRGELATAAESWIDESGALNIVLLIPPKESGYVVFRRCGLLDRSGDEIGGIGVFIKQGPTPSL